MGITRPSWSISAGAALLLTGAGVLLFASQAISGARVEVARFSQGNMEGWQTRQFAGETHYSLESRDRSIALRAESAAGASGFYREIRLDLAETPILNWSWKINGVLSGNDERSREGDDYPARLYVVFSSGMAFWRTHAVNYVWSSHQAIGSTWPNAYTGHAQMVAVRSGTEDSGRWVSERRDVRADYQKLFGRDPGPVAAVAIMTDTDNTGASATAWYGDIWFSAD